MHLGESHWVWNVSVSLRYLTLSYHSLFDNHVQGMTTSKRSSIQPTFFQVSKTLMGQTLDISVCVPMLPPTIQISELDYSETMPGGDISTCF